MIRVARRIEPPARLANRSAHFKDDVRTALDVDFVGKCYLCEGVASLSFDVEHLRPQCDFPELAFDWHNLFPAHSRCNERRKTWPVADREPGHKSWPKGGLLDCARDDVGFRLVQSFVIDVGRPTAKFSATDPGDSAAVNTASELEAIHSARSFWGRQILCELDRRYADVTRAYADLLQLVRKFAGNWEEDDVRIQQTRAKEMLSRHTPYAGLIRSKMRESTPPGLHPILGL